MSVQVVRRVRLPADHNSPATARAVVRAVLDEVALTGVLDEALLLTTELCTNGVLHAGTEMELEVVADEHSLVVTVVDFRPVAVGDKSSRWLTEAPRPSSSTADRGRGLLLVDQLAAAWGTMHNQSGKGIWFRLGRNGDATAGRPATSRGPTTPSATNVPQLTPEQLAVLAGTGDRRETVGLGEVITDLLCRLCQVVGASGGTVAVDEADGRGPRITATYGAPLHSLTGTMRVPLPLSRPWRGELEYAPPPVPHARPLAQLTAERIALTLENDRLRRASSQRRSWLTFLAEASELLAQSLDVDLTMALIPQLVVPRLGQWCALHTANEFGELRLAAATHTDEAALSGLLDSLAPALPKLSEVVRADGAVPLGPPVDGYAVALVARGQQLGVLSVGRHPGYRQAPEEVGVVEDVARRAALAIDNARIHAERRRVAQALQLSLLPPAMPTVDGIDFAAEYVPTGEGVEVGGDFYDVVALSPQRWLVVVGDVSGKGVQAATVTRLVRDVSRVLLRDGRSLPEVLSRLNDTLFEQGNGRYCTLAMAAVSQGGGADLDVSLYLAGHDQPVLLRADGQVSGVGSHGTALGLLERVSSAPQRLTLGPGDTLIFYTDGVTERRRGRELFGLARLCREASPLAGFPAHVVASRLRTAALSFSADAPRDDIAILALRNDRLP